MWNQQTKRFSVAMTGFLLAASLVGCTSTSGGLQLAGDIYGMSPKPLGRISSVILNAAAEEARREEARLQWASCPTCSRRSQWPRAGLRDNQGRARCDCGCVFVIQGYSS